MRAAERCTWQQGREEEPAILTRLPPCIVRRQQMPASCNTISCGSLAHSTAMSTRRLLPYVVLPWKRAGPQRRTSDMAGETLERWGGAKGAKLGEGDKDRCWGIKGKRRRCAVCLHHAAKSADRKMPQVPMCLHSNANSIGASALACMCTRCACLTRLPYAPASRVAPHPLTHAQSSLHPLPPSLNHSVFVELWRARCCNSRP